MGQLCRSYPAATADYKSPCSYWPTRVCCHTLTKPDCLAPLQNSTWSKWTRDHQWRDSTSGIMVDSMKPISENFRNHPEIWDSTILPGWEPLCWWSPCGTLTHGSVLQIVPGMITSLPLKKARSSSYWSRPWFRLDETYALPPMDATPLRLFLEGPLSPPHHLWQNFEEVVFWMQNAETRSLKKRLVKTRFRGLCVNGASRWFLSWMGGCAHGRVRKDESERKIL